MNEAARVTRALPFSIVCDSRERPAWLLARNAYVGASESSTVLGENKHDALLKLWAIKTGQIKEPDLSDNEAVFWGQELEDAIIHGFAKRSKRTVVPFGLMLASARFPWLSATPDALVTDNDDAAKRALLITRTIGHIRTALKKGDDTGHLTQVLVETCKGWWPLQVKNIGMRSAEDWETGVPIYYRIQCAHEAIVFGATCTTGAALITGQQLAWEDLQLDEDGVLFRQIVNLTRGFMDRNVRGRVQPPPDGTESARRALDALYPRHKPETVLRLDADLLLLAEERDQLVEKRLATQKRIDEIDNIVRAAMEDNEAALFPDGSGFTLKAVDVKSYTVAARTDRKLLRKPAKKGGE